MDIKEALSGVYTKGQIEAVAKYACKNNKNFQELIDIFKGEDTKLAQMASWSLSFVVRMDKKKVLPYLKDIVAQLNRADVHDAVIRNSVRVLQDVDIPEEFHGNVMNACFLYVEKPSIPAAIKAFSLTVLYNLCKQYPEISSELELIMQEQWDNETPAFKSRARKILQQLKKRK